MHRKTVPCTPRLHLNSRAQSGQGAGPIKAADKLTHKCCLQAFDAGDWEQAITPSAADSAWELEHPPPPPPPAASVRPSLQLCLGQVRQWAFSAFRLPTHASAIHQHADSAWELEHPSPATTTSCRQRAALPASHTHAASVSGECTICACAGVCVRACVRVGVCAVHLADLSRICLASSTINVRCCAAGCRQGAARAGVCCDVCDCQTSLAGACGHPFAAQPADSLLSCSPRGSVQSPQSAGFNPHEAQSAQQPRLLPRDAPAALPASSRGAAAPLATGTAARPANAAPQPRATSWRGILTGMLLPYKAAVSSSEGNGCKLHLLPSCTNAAKCPDCGGAPCYLLAWHPHRLVVGSQR